MCLLNFRVNLTLCVNLSNAFIQSGTHLYFKTAFIYEIMRPTELSVAVTATLKGSSHKYIVAAGNDLLWNYDLAEFYKTPLKRIN